ncbi:MAG: hypothetical protein ACRCXT_15465 [Paraclostridium sp.]
MESIFTDERVLNYYKKRIKHKRYDTKDEIFFIINDIIETSKVNYEITITEDQALDFFYKGIEEDIILEPTSLRGEVAKFVEKIKATLYYCQKGIKEVFNV